LSWKKEEKNGSTADAIQFEVYYKMIEDIDTVYSIFDNEKVIHKPYFGFDLFSSVVTVYVMTFIFRSVYIFF